MFRITLFFSVTLFALCSAPPVRAAAECAALNNLVQNCGFETGDFSSWILAGDIAHAGVDHADAHSGAFGAYLGGLGSFDSGQTNFTFLSQVLNTQPGVTYQLSYYTAHFTNAVVKPDNIFAASLSGVEIPASRQENVAQANFSEAGPFKFVAKAPTTTLSFLAEDANFYFSLDDVSVTSTATPEPATWLLIVITLGLGGVVRLRSTGMCR